MEWEITQLLENREKWHVLEMMCNMNVISLLCTRSVYTHTQTCSHASRPYTLSLAASPLAACWWATLKSQSWQMMRNPQQNRTRGGNWWVFYPVLKGHWCYTLLSMTHATKWLLLMRYSGWWYSTLNWFNELNSLHCYFSSQTNRSKSV